MTPIPHRIASTGGSAKPRTSRAAPIRTVTQKKALAALVEQMSAAYWNAGSGLRWDDPAAGWFRRHVRSGMRAVIKECRIITKPRRTAKGTR